MCAALSTSNIEAQESSVCFHCPLVTVYWCYSTKAKKPTEHESLSHYYGFFGCMLFLYGDPPKKFNCTDRNPYASIYRQILCNLLSAACSGHFHWMMHLLPCPTFHVTDLLYIYMCVYVPVSTKQTFAHLYCIPKCNSLTYITYMFGQCYHFSPQRSLMLFQWLAKEGRYKRATLAERLGCNHNYSTAELITNQIGLFECLW